MVHSARAGGGEQFLVVKDPSHLQETSCSGRVLSHLHQCLLGFVGASNAWPDVLWLHRVSATWVTACPHSILAEGPQPLGSD